LRVVLNPPRGFRVVGELLEKSYVRWQALLLRVLVSERRAAQPVASREAMAVFGTIAARFAFCVLITGLPAPAAFGRSLFSHLASPPCHKGHRRDRRGGSEHRPGGC